MLSHHQQQTLKAHAHDSNILDAVIAQIKRQSPEKFHTEESLKHRVFFNEPKHNLPCAGFIHPLPKQI